MPKPGQCVAWLKSKSPDGLLRQCKRDAKSVNSVGELCCGVHSDTGRAGRKRAVAAGAKARESNKKRHMEGWRTRNYKASISDITEAEAVTLFEHLDSLVERGELPTDLCRVISNMRKVQKPKV